LEARILTAARGATDVEERPGPTLEPRHGPFVPLSPRRARTDGNTQLLARAAAEQLPGDTDQRWLDLAQLRLPDYRDARHAPGPWPEEENDEALLWEATLAATDVVIASPLYWYSLSSYAKRYLDY
jgi:NAD(P)H-dependent FMN reductase